MAIRTNSLRRWNDLVTVLMITIWRSIKYNWFTQFTGACVQFQRVHIYNPDSVYFLMAQAKPVCWKQNHFVNCFHVGKRLEADKSYCMHFLHETRKPTSNCKPERQQNLDKNIVKRNTNFHELINFIFFPKKYTVS